jgi:hypothetical protein
VVPLSAASRFLISNIPSAILKNEFHRISKVLEITVKTGENSCDSPIGFAFAKARVWLYKKGSPHETKIPPNTRGRYVHHFPGILILQRINAGYPN